MEKYERKGYEGVKYFVGPTVDHTFAHNKKTLFVVGLHDTATVKRLAEEHKVKNISLGANRSFVYAEDIKGVKLTNRLGKKWGNQIRDLLAAGFMVSLEYSAHEHEEVLTVLGDDIWSSRQFVPVLSIQVPNISTSNVNLTVKFDDSNFGATNPGVWCFNHHEVTDSNRFTSWEEMGDNLIIQEGITKTPGSGKVVEVDVADMDADDALEAVTKVMKEHSDVKNDGELGLDRKSKSALKPDPAETLSSISEVIPKNPEEAAEAYASGTTKDPLSEVESKKPKATKPAK